MRTRLDPATRERQLVEEALALAAERGLAAMTFDDVAGAAGVKRSLLYRYFPGGKPDLVLAVVEEGWRRLLARIDTDPDRPLAEKTPANIETFLDAAGGGDPAFVVVAQARHSHDPRVQRAGRRARRAWSRAMARNHGAEPTEPVLAALSGYLVYCELVMEEWRVHGALNRLQAQALLTKPLPALLAAAAG